MLIFFLGLVNIQNNQYHSYNDLHNTYGYTYTEHGWCNGLGIVLVNKTLNEETFVVVAPELE